MVIDTMVAYYGNQGTKACILTASVFGENPVGALALACAAVGSRFARYPLPLSYGFLQVERALCMHTLGMFVMGDPFSEKACGSRTDVYLKLANDMTVTQWAGFYGMLRVHEDIQGRLKECNKPAEQWTDDPEEYLIMESDSEEE
jgi:hypothetical protein